MNSNNETITACSKTLNVAPACKPVSLSLASLNSNKLNYLDVNTDQTILCMPDGKSFGASSSSEFDWILSEGNSTVNMLSSFNSKQVKENGKTLTIQKNTLLINKNYTITCAVSGLLNCG